MAILTINAVLAVRAILAICTCLTFQRSQPLLLAADISLFYCNVIGTLSVPAVRAVSAISPVFAVRAVSAISPVFAVRAVPAVRAVSAISPVLAINTIPAIGPVLTVSAVLTVRPGISFISFGPHKGSQPFFHRAGKGSCLYGNVVGTFAVSTLFSYNIRDIACRMVRRGAFRLCSPENGFYDKIIRKPSVKIFIFILSYALAYLSYFGKLLRYFNHIYGKAHILLKGRVACVGIRPGKTYAVFLSVKSGPKICNGRSQPLYVRQFVSVNRNISRAGFFPLGILIFVYKIRIPLGDLPGKIIGPYSLL